MAFPLREKMHGLSRNQYMKSKEVENSTEGTVTNGDAGKMAQRRVTEIEGNRS